MRRALLAALLLSGCTQILDLEERPFADLDAGDHVHAMMDSTVTVLPDGFVPPPPAPECTRYCELSAQLCNADNMAQSYETDPQCLAVCKLTPPGEVGGPPGNTVACRTGLLENALQFGEASTICQAAGPLGGAFQGSGSSCGSQCESFCNLRTTVCGDLTEPNCLAKCQGIPSTQEQTYNAAADFRSGKDSLACRMAHLVTAAAYQAQGDETSRKDHCNHSSYKSTSPCEIKASDVPSCADYCRIVDVACPGEQKVYEDVAQCEAVCAELPNMADDSKTADTVRCRREQAYEALRLGGTPRGCAAAGPVPAECGGSKCAAFCSLLEGACGGDPAFGSRAECMTACAQNPDSMINSNVAIANASGNTLSCRTMYLMRVIRNNDVRDCASALGTPSGFCR